MAEVQQPSTARVDARTTTGAAWSPPRAVVAEIVAVALAKTVLWLAYRRRRFGWRTQGAVMRWERGGVGRRRPTRRHRAAAQHRRGHRATTRP